MDGNAFLIPTNEHCVVIVCRLVDQSGIEEGIKHLTVDASLVQEIRIRSTIVIIPQW